MLTVGTARTPEEAVAALHRNLKEAMSHGVFGQLTLTVQLAHGRPVAVRTEAAVTYAEPRGKPEPKTEAAVTGKPG